ncbi:MAG: rhamnulokinase [Lachnospiraceae bacterium]|nr:rhamnulokinase [Lachnospiraceae bacterium]
MDKYYLAIDIGASSGRHILCHMNNGIMELSEIHRFDNGMEEVNGSKCWNTKVLFSEIKEGMKKCKEMGKIPVSVAIDTWGVDFVLLDGDGNLIGDAVGYRDNRTKGMDEEVYRYIQEEELYLRTGIQKQLYNTIYQLMALKKNNPEYLEKAETLLFTPDYYHYLLTGKKAAEYTIATTGQLVNPKTKDWDYELIDMLGYPKNIFPKMYEPGTVLGELSAPMQEEIGYNCKVIMPASHDTASAVMSVPAMGNDTLYISSGTWSLMGVESDTAICTKESMKANFTNEGGYGHTYRFLKNIMGLWMIQSVRGEWEHKYSYGELCEMAEKEKDFPSRVNVNDDRFFAPDSMIEAIREYCRETSQEVPVTIGQLATVVYQSLADSYKMAVEEIESMTGRKYDAINIIGGGSKADYLNELTAEKTGRTVYAGPTEATAIGNIVAQMIEDGAFESLSQARENIFKSFGVKKYQSR